MDQAPTPAVPAPSLPAPNPPVTGTVAPTVPARRSAFVATVLGWLVPGFGQLYVGRPRRALLMLLTIGGLFLGGLALTGFTCVNPRSYALEFVAHALLGGPTAATYYLTRGIELTQPLPWFEVGRLYAAVAGLLNVVAICDALSDVIEHNRHVASQALRRRRFFLEREAEVARLLLAQEPAQTASEQPDETLEGEALEGEALEGEASEGESLA